MPKIKRALSDSEEEQSDSSESFVGVPSRRSQRMVPKSVQNKLEYRVSHPLRKNLRRRPIQIKSAEPVCDVCSQSYLENDLSPPQELVFCSQCCKSVHPGCIDLSEETAITICSYQWRCLKCKICAVCKSSGNKNNLVLCKICDRGYHQQCLPMHHRAKGSGNWSCEKCVQGKKSLEADSDIFSAEVSTDTEATTTKPSPSRKRTCVLKTSKSAAQHGKELPKRIPLVRLVKMNSATSTAKHPLSSSRSEDDSLSDSGSELELGFTSMKRASPSKRIVETPSPSPLPQTPRQLCFKPNSSMDITNGIDQLHEPTGLVASAIKDNSKDVVKALHELTRVIKVQTVAIRQQNVFLEELQAFFQ